MLLKSGFRFAEVPCKPGIAEPSGLRPVIFIVPGVGPAPLSSELSVKFVVPVSSNVPVVTEPGDVPGGESDTENCTPNSREELLPGPDP